VKYFILYYTYLFPIHEAAMTPRYTSQLMCFNVLESTAYSGITLCQKRTWKKCYMKWRFKILKEPLLFRINWTSRNEVSPFRK